MPMPVPQQQTPPMPQGQSPQQSPQPLAGFPGQPQQPQAAQPMPVAQSPQPDPRQKIQQGVQKATATLSKAATSLPQVVQQSVQQHDSMTKLRDKQVIDLVANSHVAQVTALDKINNQLKPLVEELDQHMKEAQALPDSDPQKIGKIGYLAHLHADVVGAIKQQMQAVQQSQQAVQAIMADPKNRKLLSKAVGYDEKQANSPERQMMIAAINAGMQQIQQGAKKAMANLPPPVPQTQQGEGPNPNMPPSALGGSESVPPLPASAAQPPNVQQGTPKWGQMSGGQKLARVAEIIGTIAMPQQMQLIPGTPQNKQLLQQKAIALQEQLLKMKQEEATIEETKAKAGAAALTPASQEEADAYGVPVGTMLNAASRAALAKQAGINVTKVKTTGMTDQTRKDIADAGNLTKIKLAQLKPEQRDDRAIRLMEKPPEDRTQEENAYLGAYARWVEQTKVLPGVARAQAFGSFRPVQVVNADGSTRYEFSGQAISSGAPGTSSLPFRTAVRMASYMTSGKGGVTLTAYRTAYDHLDLLQKAVDALQNGDMQTLNSMNNFFKEQFGQPAPTNFDAIKTMLAGEVANVAKATGATDQEIEATRKEFVRNASPAQFAGVIQSNQDLLDQKAQEMLKQYTGGMQGQPVFGHGATAGGGPTPQTHKFSVSAWQRANPKGDVNAAKAAAQQQNYQIVP
jgi:hypothetical protein